METRRKRKGKRNSPYIRPKIEVVTIGIPTLLAGSTGGAGTGGSETIPSKSNNYLIEEDTWDDNSVWSK